MNNTNNNSMVRSIPVEESFAKSPSVKNEQTPAVKKPSNIFRALKEASSHPGQDVNIQNSIQFDCHVSPVKFELAKKNEQHTAMSLETDYKDENLSATSPTSDSFMSMSILKFLEKRNGPSSNLILFQQE